MKIDSLRLQQLQAELHQSNHTALDKFWAEVAASGAPLIEPTDDGDCLITFLWRDGGHTENVVVIQDWGADGIYEHFMTQLLDTDLWFKTRRMRSDTRTTYQLAPTPIADPNNAFPLQLDPLNPHIHTAFLGEGGNNIRFSYL